MRGRVFGRLGRYMALQNLFLMFVCLGVGVGIYMLSDIFDRLDDFVEAGLGAGDILYYFLVKLPLILSQILPAVFLLAMVVQLGVMSRTREMVALRAGGVSSGWFLRFFLFYAVFWSVLLLCFSQVLGVYGEREARRIWKEDVRKGQYTKRTINNLWFREGGFIVQADRVMLGRELAENITAYRIQRESNRLEKIITAQKADIKAEGWLLKNALTLDTATFEDTVQSELLLPVHQDMNAFLATDSEASQSKQPLWRLSRVISELEASGSNVQNLKTAWHSKLSYAFSIVVMALIALAVVTFTENVYIGIMLSLVLVFTYYGAYVIGESAGQRGLLPPFVAAWMGNLFFSAAAGLRLTWVESPRLQKRVRKLLDGLPIPRTGRPA